VETLDFLTAVLPSTGYYCVCELTTRAKQHYFVETLDEVHNVALLHDQAEHNTYFALASFETPGKREATNARYMRALFIDVDCGAGKAYPDKRAGVEALSAFLEASDLLALGKPWIVDSGGGIHAYWPLNEDVAVSDWKPVAEGFKRMCARHHFHIDMTVTADAARVLRMPGTHNWKYPRPVNLRFRGDTFALADLAARVAEYTSVAPVSALGIPGTPLKRSPTEAGVKLLANQTVSFKDILQRTVNGSGCGQLAHYLEHAQEDGMEPLWRGLLSLTKVCTDGTKAAKRLSAMHPYDEQRMFIKLTEIKGPYPCVKFDSENLGICTACPHWGKITNPLRLGASVELDTSEKEIEVSLDPTDADVPVQRYVRPVPPRGFGYGAKAGGVYRDVVEEDAEGNKIKTQKQILTYELFVIDVLNAAGVHAAQMVVSRNGSYQTLSYPMRAAASKDDTIKFLAENNVIACYGKGNDAHLYDYVRACVEEASARSVPTAVPQQYGWQDDMSFVHNGRVYFPDGTERQVPMPGLENITRATRVAGSLEGWRRIISLLDKRGMHEIIAHACIGFGSPLMRFSGIHGLTFHAGHKASGTGKSLALNLCSSIWGPPLQYRTGKDTSVVAMQQRAGNLNGLPFNVDELTDLARVNANWFPAFTFTFSEGKGKERMEAGANKERLNNSTWYGLAFFTSNTFMLDIMTGMSEHSAEGEIRRFLEWNPGVQLSWTPSELTTIRTIDVHYGIAGEVYAKWLVRNRALAEQMYRRVQDRLFQAFNATNDERFWVAGVAAIVTGAILCGSKYADVYDFDVKSITEALRADVERGRMSLLGTKRTAEDVLNSYIREFYGNLVVVEKDLTPGGLLKAKFGNGDEIDKSITRTKVLGRVEKEILPGYTDLYIEERMMKRHCASLSFGYAEFIKDLRKVARVEQVQKNLLANTRGPQMRCPALRICRATHETQVEATEDPV